MEAEGFRWTPKTERDSIESFINYSSYLNRVQSVWLAFIVSLFLHSTYKLVLDGNIIRWGESLAYQTVMIVWICRGRSWFRSVLAMCVYAKATSEAMYMYKALACSLSRNLGAKQSIRSEKSYSI